MPLKIDEAIEAEVAKERASDARHVEAGLTVNDESVEATAGLSTGSWTVAGILRWLRGSSAKEAAVRVTKEL